MTSPCSVSRWLRCDERQRGASKPPGLRGGLWPAESGAPVPLVSRLGARAPRTSTSGSGSGASWLVSAAAHRSRPAPAVKELASLARCAAPSASLTAGPCRSAGRRGCRHGLRPRRRRAAAVLVGGHTDRGLKATVRMTSSDPSPRWLRCDERQRGASKPPGLSGGLCPAQSGAPVPLVSRLGAGAPRTSTSGSWGVEHAVDPAVRRGVGRGQGRSGSGVLMVSVPTGVTRKWAPLGLVHR